jgi:hypothetical protein
MRPSDDTRERIISALTRGCADGRLSPSTFADRIDVALAAADHRALDALVADLPPPRAPEPSGWWERLRGLAAQRIARGVPAPAPLRMPEHAPESEREFVIGRAANCDMTVHEPTVSRRHAAVRREGGGWVILDLGSTNGMRVNGWRAERARLREGDEVRLGRARLVVVGRGGRPVSG